MADYGIKISPNGVDVKTAADKDLVYTTKYNAMKIFKHGSGSGGASIAHGAGYIPAFVSFENSAIPDGRYRFSGADSIDATNINLTYDSFYFIFVDKLA